MRTRVRAAKFWRLVLSASVAATPALAQEAPAAGEAPVTPEPAGPPPAEQTAPVGEKPVLAPPATAAPASVPPAAADATTPSQAQAPPDESGFVSVGEPGTESAGAAQEGPKLEIYGFADFSYSQLLVSKDSEWLLAYHEHGSFFVGHLNLYLSSELAERWRSLIEVRFSYLPHGNEVVDGSGRYIRTDTTVNDYAEYEKENRWGSVIIERAWLEYSPFDFLSIRGGEWLTPYGYWNEDHGSPTITSVNRPFVISDALFPEHQTGLEAHGQAYIDQTTIGYHLTLSNGRGPIDTYRDLDGNKAVGGRVYLQTKLLGDLELGSAFYRGRYTDSYRVASLDAAGQPQIDVVRTVVYDELSLAGDLRFRWNDFLLQSELVMNEAAFDDAARPVSEGIDPTFHTQADYRRWGAYGLIGYRTPWLGLMPYALIEYCSFANRDAVPPAFGYTFGVNIRPTPSVVLKAELVTGEFKGVGSTGLGDEPLRILATQAAWAF